MDENGVYYSFTMPFRKWISKITEGNVDVINYDLLEDTYLKDAVKKGVVVYGNDVSSI